MKAKFTIGGAAGASNATKPSATNTSGSGKS
jgi:hypothetical protein